MAFTFTNYPILTPEQANPFQGALSNALKTYNQGVDTAFKMPNLQEQLLKAQLGNQHIGLENKWYEPAMKSEIGLRGAQAGAAGAHAALLGEQRHGVELQNQFLPAQLKNQIQAEMFKQQLFNQMLGSPSQAQQQSIPGTLQQPMQAGGGLSGVPSESNVQVPFRMPEQQMQAPQQVGSMPSYGSAALAMKLMGLPKPQIENINGQYTALTPFGNIPVAQGMTKLQEALVTRNADRITDLDKISLQGGIKGESYNQMQKILTDPIMQEVRSNPVLMQHELSWFSKFGTPEQQEHIGRLKASMGNIITAAAGDFKGAFRSGEQGLLNSMKPNESDTVQVMTGKMEALEYLNKIMMQRAEFESDALRQGKSPSEARKLADSIMHPEEIEKQVKKRYQSPPLEAIEKELAKRGVK